MENGGNFELMGLKDEFVTNLRRLLEEVPNTKIVISSSWRTSEIMETVSDTIPWKAVLNSMLGRVAIVKSWGAIGEAGEFGDAKDGRAGDISRWLKDYGWKLGVGRYVILDDNPSQNGISKFFPNNTIDCSRNGEFGFTEKRFNEAKWILTGFGREKPLDNRTWFTSDQHFGHANIIKYCNRPFKSVEEMDAAMVERWNKTVGKDDMVWCLGDICLGDRSRLKDLVSSLNGRINLVMGNHDTKKIGFYYDAGFNRVYDRPVLLGGFILLSHEPLEWVKRPMFNIFGHVHDNSIYRTFSPEGCCVCVERHDYAPVNWETITVNCKEEGNADS